MFPLAVKQLRTTIATLAGNQEKAILLSAVNERILPDYSLMLRREGGWDQGTHQQNNSLPYSLPR